MYSDFRSPLRGVARQHAVCVAVLLTLGVMSAPAPALAQPQPPADAQRSYAIAQGPLAEALNQFASEAGVVLAFDASQLASLRTRGLQGRHGVSAGFAALLAGTEWTVVQTAPGSYVLRKRPPTPPQSSQDSGEKTQPGLPPVRIAASRLATVEQLDRQMIRTMPAINGDLTSQLKLNPNVQYDDSQLSSNTGGEIAPAQISIHGAKPYQNELLLDGVSIANDLDPGTNVATNNPSLIPGSAQALAIDSSILCAVDVRDSNVSAEYGRFNGGVVEATVCSARKRLGGSVSVGYTSSDWTQLIIDDARREAFENSTDATNQPRFKKWTYKATLETRPTDDFGVLMSVVRSRSEIPLKHFNTANAGSPDPQEVTQTRTQDTFLLKGDWSPARGPHKAEATLVYAPSNNTYFVENIRDSDHTLKSGGLNVSGKLVSSYEPLTLTQQLSFSNNDQSRRSQSDDYRPWRWSTDKNWGDPTRTNATSIEGGWGDLDQTLQTLNYKVKSAFKAFDLGRTQHRVAAGLELRRQQASYARLSETRSYSTVRDLPATGAISRCEQADGTVDIDACSTTPSINRTVGQYFGRLQSYAKGAFDLSAESYAAYVEDAMTWRNFVLRLGVRADQDSLTGNLNAGPRSSLTWQVSEPLSLNVGANRYYGRNLFAFAMQEKVNTLMYVQTRTNTLTWSDAVQSKPSNRLQDMKTPFDDELTTGLSYETPWGPLSVRYTHREGHDQVVKRTVTRQTDCAGNQCYIYTNEGQSEAQDLTVSWSSAQAFKLGPVATRAWLAVNKTNVKSNFASYDSGYSINQADDAIIQYDGQFMRYSERPADNYNRPWTLRVGAMSTWPSRQLTVTNILRVRDGSRQILRNGTTLYNGTTVDVWEKTSLPRALALDTVLMWSPRLDSGQQLDVKLTIENLTNRKNKISVSDTYATYERGRTIALEIGCSF